MPKRRAPALGCSVAGTAARTINLACTSESTGSPAIFPATIPRPAAPSTRSESGLDQIDSAVVLPAFGRRIWPNGLRGAKACSPHPRRDDAVFADEILLYGERSLLGERLVRGRAADVVGMVLDGEAERPVRLEHIRDLGQRRRRSEEHTSELQSR